MGGPDAFGFLEGQPVDPFKSRLEVELAKFAELAVRRLGSVKRACQHEAQDGLPELVQVGLCERLTNEHGD